VLSTPLVLGQGRILWNEATDGFLSRTYVSPTFLGALSFGTNSIIGSTEATPHDGNWGLDDDYFTFQISAGSQVSGAYLIINQQVLAWLGTADFNNEIGHRTISTTQDLLPFFGGNSLLAGNYGMFLSDRDLQDFPTSVGYRLDLVVTAVPEPGTWALLALGSALFWSFTRRRP
jgi:hypothetical protein